MPAIASTQAALRLSPRDLEIHHTVGTIYERMHKYEEAAGAYTNYVNLLPNKDRSEKADWSRAEIRFLRSFGQRVPFEMDPGADERLYTADFKLVKDARNAIVHIRGRPTNVAGVASVARRLVDHAITSAVREDVIAATKGPGDQPAV